MTTLIQAAELALEALRDAHDRARPDGTRLDYSQEIAVLRRALALEKMAENERELGIQMQPNEPVAYAVKTVGGKKWHSIHASKGASDKWLEYRVKERAQGESYEQHTLYTRPQPAEFVCSTGLCYYKPADEPVIDESAAKRIATALGWEPKREWVDLTDEDIDDIYQGAGKNDLLRAREVLAKFKEKNA